MGQSGDAAASVAPAAEASGFGDEQLKSGDRPVRATEPALRAHVTSTRKSTGGIYLIVLDNGQVWQHEQGSQAQLLAAGDAVTITRAALGSYRLTRDAGSAKNWIRVARTR